MNSYFAAILLLLLPLFDLFGQADMCEIESFDITKNTNAVPYTYKISSSSDRSELDLRNFQCDNLRRNIGSFLEEHKQENRSLYFLKIFNPSNQSQKRLLYFGNTTLDEVYLSEVIENRIVNTLAFAEKMPLIQRDVPNRNAVFQIELDAKSNQHLLIDIRHKGVHLYTDIELISERKFHLADSKRNVLFGFYFVLEIVLILMIPILYFFLKDIKLLFIYVTYHVVIVLFTADYYGFLLTYVTPQLSEYEKHIGIAGYILFTALLGELNKVLLKENFHKVLDTLRYSIYIIGLLPLLHGKFLPSWYLETFALFIMASFFFTQVRIYQMLFKNIKSQSIEVKILLLGAMIMTAVSLYETYYYIDLIQFNLLAKYSFIIGAISQTIAFFIFIVFAMMRSVRLLDQAKIEAQRQEIQLNTKLNEERNRISSEIHDDIGSGLSLIKFLSNKIQSSNDRSKDLEDIRQIHSRSHELIENLGEMIWALDSDHNSLDDLVIHLKHYTLKYLSALGVQLNFEVIREVPQLEVSNEFRRNILLIIKEVLQNIAKHAQAKNVNLEIATRHDLQISIADDGIGYDQTQINHGHGLKNIKARVRRLNGKITILQRNGVEINIDIPLYDAI